MEELVGKYLAREATVDEIKEVEAWIDENPDPFFEFKEIWALTTNKAPETVLPVNLTSQKQFKLVSYWKYGVAASLIIGLSLVFLLNIGNNNSNKLYQELPDGTMITLKEGASFNVINFDQKVREIKVDGIAFLEVERDESRPFIVHLDLAKVSVLGTSFMVKSDNVGDEVCVASGAVELSKSSSDNKISVELTQGEMGSVSIGNKGIIKKKNDNPNYLSWKTKAISFNETKINEVVSVLEDVYDLKIKIENPSFANCKFTAKFTRDKPKDILEVLSRTFDIDYEIKGKKVVLKGKGC